MVQDKERRRLQAERERAAKATQSQAGKGAAAAGGTQRGGAGPSAAAPPPPPPRPAVPTTASARSSSSSSSAAAAAAAPSASRPPPVAAAPAPAREQWREGAADFALDDDGELAVAPPAGAATGPLEGKRYDWRRMLPGKQGSLAAAERGLSGVGEETDVSSSAVASVFGEVQDPQEAAALAAQVRRNASN